MVIKGGPATAFFVGSCSLIITFVESITNDMSHFNESLMPTQTEQNQEANVKNQFHNILKDFSDAKELRSISLEKSKSQNCPTDQMLKCISLEL